MSGAAADRMRSEFGVVALADRERWCEVEAAALGALDDLRTELHQLARRHGKREAARLTGLSSSSVQRWSLEVPSAAALRAAALARRGES